MILHVHKDKTDGLEMNRKANELVSLNQSRMLANIWRGESQKWGGGALAPLAPPPPPLSTSLAGQPLATPARLPVYTLALTNNRITMKPPAHGQRSLPHAQAPAGHVGNTGPSLDHWPARAIRPSLIHSLAHSALAGPAGPSLAVQAPPASSGPLSWGPSLANSAIEAPRTNFARCTWLDFLMLLPIPCM